MWALITGVSSSVIALCAFILAIWQGVQLRKHHRLSVRPHLTIWINNESENGLYVVDLLNNGLGPAIIETFNVQVDGVRLSNENDSALGKAVGEIFSEHEYKARYGNFGDDYAMQSKERCLLLSLQFYGKKIPSENSVKDSLKRIAISIDYASFYGEKFAFTTKDED